MSDEVPGDEHGDECGGDGQVSGDDAAGTAGQRDECGDGGQLVTNHDGIGGLQREGITGWTPGNRRRRSPDVPGASPPPETSYFSVV